MGYPSQFPDNEIEYAARDALVEIDKATAAWPPFNSAHEGFAILKEEVDELWDHVKMNQKKRDIEALKNIGREYWNPHRWIPFTTPFGAVNQLALAFSASAVFGSNLSFSYIKI